MVIDKELLALSDVANICGTSNSNVSNWRKRDNSFPVPFAETSAGPIWKSEDIVEYLHQKKNMMQYQQEILKRKRFQLLVEHGVENHFLVPGLLWTRLGLLSCSVVIAMIKQYVRYILRFQSQYC